MFRLMTVAIIRLITRI